MICPCGKQWDVTDTPPACKPIHPARQKYLTVIKQMFGVVPKGKNK
jgi:hypothetical protein